MRHVTVTVTDIVRQSLTKADRLPSRSAFDVSGRQRSSPTREWQGGTDTNEELQRRTGRLSLHTCRRISRRAGAQPGPAPTHIVGQSAPRKRRYSRQAQHAGVPQSVESQFIRRAG